MYDFQDSARCAGDAERERSRISEAIGGFNREAAVKAKRERRVARQFAQTYRKMQITRKACGHPSVISQKI